MARLYTIRMCSKHLRISYYIKKAWELAYQVFSDEKDLAVALISSQIQKSDRSEENLLLRVLDVTLQ